MWAQEERVATQIVPFIDVQFRGGMDCYDITSNPHGIVDGHISGGQPLTCDRGFGLS